MKEAKSDNDNGLLLRRRQGNPLLRHSISSCSRKDSNYDGDSKKGNIILTSSVRGGIELTWHQLQ